MADSSSSAKSDMQTSTDRGQEDVDDEEEDPFEKRIDDSGCAKYHFALQVNYISLIYIPHMSRHATTKWTSISPEQDSHSDSEQDSDSQKSHNVSTIM